MSGGNMLAVGSRAPDFTAQTGEGTPVTLSKLLEKGHVVLVFYPGNNTPG